MYVENEFVELKRELTKEIKKEIVAFANSKGGTIYIGIDDTGKVIGLKDCNKDAEALSGMIREGIKSDLTLYTNIIIETVEGKKIIILKVMSGSNKPYYLADKGLKLSGVFIRHGNVSAPATDELIKRLILENHDTFENLVSQNQDLHFAYLNSIFSDKQKELSITKYKLLNIINNDNLYTNLGLLLSDECPFTIKCAVFNGNNKLSFKDRKEFKGSLLKQLEDTLNYLNIVNKISGRIINYKRIDIRDYPEFALRETILNAIIHRNYNFSGSILVSVFDDRIEVTSLGGLMVGLSIDDIISGVSQTRNKNLASIFYRLEYVENYGTGIGRMIDVYKEFNLKPEFATTDNSFKVILPNVNYKPKVQDTLINSLSQKEIIINYLKDNNKIKREVVDAMFNISSARSKKILLEMMNENTITKKGTGRNTYYVLK